MVHEATETLTIRIPRALKALVEEAAKARGMTVTGVVRQALQETITPAGRLYQHPGMSEAFEKFLDDARGKRVMLLVIDERSGLRYFFEGAVDRDLTNESIVAISRKHARSPWIIPRRDVVAWVEDPAVINQVAISLTQQGWQARSPGEHLPR
jgi:uncharacterized protein (DUF1778 family)